MRKLKNSTFLTEDAEALFEEFIALIPNLREEELPTLRLGCQYLADFNRINKMDLDFTQKDRDTYRLNPLLRYKKTCFDAWLVVAKRYGLDYHKKLNRVKRKTPLSDQLTPLRGVKLASEK